MDSNPWITIGETTSLSQEEKRQAHPFLSMKLSKALLPDPKAFMPSHGKSQGRHLAACKAFEPPSSPLGRRKPGKAYVPSPGIVQSQEILCSKYLLQPHKSLNGQSSTVPTMYFPIGPKIKEKYKQKVKPTVCLQLDLWDHSRSEPISSFSWGADTLIAVRFNPAEPDILASCASDRSLALYDLRHSTPIRKLVMQVRRHVTSMSISASLNVMG